MGARSLQECLLLQLRFRGDSFAETGSAQKEIVDTAMTIVEEYLYDLADGRLSKIAAQLNLSMKEIQKAVDTIKNLDPKPGRNFGNNGENRFITPDATIRKIDNDYFIIINEPENARLSINPIYRQLVRSKDAIDEEVIKFIKEKQNAALQLMKCIEQRKLTLYQVTESIIAIQKDFLEKGALYLKPLTLRQIAEAIGIHESTVSRAIAGKYMDTPRGIYPYKYFFTSSLDSSAGGSVSAERVKKMLKTAVDKEDPNSPLSDQQLVDTLKDKGIIISRRTVTKYREELGIPASLKRRRY